MAGSISDTESYVNRDRTKEIAKQLATGRLSFNVFASFAQIEGEIVLERQGEGIQRAKLAGKYKGRKPTARAMAEEVLNLLASGLKPTEVAKRVESGEGPSTELRQRARSP